MIKPEQTTKRKKVHIKSWGCQMNVYDGARMADVLAPHGFDAAASPDDADLIILNTCHIREKASEKLFSELGRMQELQQDARKDGKSLTLAVTGCVAQAEGEEIAIRAPYVGIIAGPQSYQFLPDLLRAHEETGRPAVKTEFPNSDKFDALPAIGTGKLIAGPALSNDRSPVAVSAFLAVQEGCDKFCTFCVVPYTRGPEYSRPAATVLQEARNLIARGVKEITLLGQNVNAWHGDAPDGGKWDLARLLYALAEIDGLERLRYSTSHPIDMQDSLIEAHGNLPELMPCLHLPVQSGSDKVLAAMNRAHKRDLYLRIIEKLHAVNSDVALSSDFIVGFPGETDQDFADTMSLVRQVGFAQAYSFKYSPRHGTPAASSLEQIPDDVQSMRLYALQDLLWKQQRAFNDTKIGHAVPVLFDRIGKRPGQILGRSPWMQSVYIEGDQSLLGQILSVNVSAATLNSLSGTLATSRSATTELKEKECAA